MQIILKANGLWEMIEPNETTQSDNKKDKTAIAFLYQALPEEQLLQITKHKTAKAIWDALKTRHIGEERVQQARLQTLKSEFEMLHMKEDETIDTFTAKLTTIVNKAASLGHTMEDETLVRKLLNVVPDRYLQIVASIEQYSDLDEMTLEEAIGRLKTYEERIKYKKGKQVDNQEKLMFTRHENKGKYFRGRGRGKHKFSQGRNHENFKEERKDGENSHKNYKRDNFKKSSYDTSKLQCYKCKKIGHIAPKCPQRTKPNEQSNLVEEDLEPTLLMAILEDEEQKVSLHEIDAPLERKLKHPIFVFFQDVRLVPKMDSLGKEILTIAVPAAMAFAADPVASLIDTAFIGHIGPVEIAAVGVSIAIFNQVSKVAIFPLVSITTSFVAEEETIERLNSKLPKDENMEKGSMVKEETQELMKDDVQLENLENGSKIRDEKKESAPEEGFKTSPCKHLTITETTRKKFKLKREKRNIPSASTALLFGAVLGLLETILLVFLAEPLLSLMGVRHGNKMLLPAHKYLTLRALGAPAVLLSLSMQGVFRGFKDTKTPLYATVAGDLANIILDPILIFVCKLGVSGAAIAHVLSQ
ncbi:zinc finger, CCHC-type containing protein [Tanacetum coccineum]